MNIIAFPFAGGDKHVYNFMKGRLEGASLIVLEYKGRGLRIKERFSETIEDVVNDFLPTIQELINNENDYVIYGHSMGALIGYLICHKLEELSLKKPLKLIASGRIAPSVIGNKKISNLSSEEFWNEIFNLGGVPDSIKNNFIMRGFFEPILKADFKVVENYIYEKNKLLSIPIDVLYGKEESNNKLDFWNWQNESSKKVNIREFEGSHFFIYNFVEDIAKYLTTAFILNKY